MGWVIAVLISFVMVGCVLYFVQDKIVFHPTRYPDGDTLLAGGQRVRLEFLTKDGEQVAYYQPPEMTDGKIPGRLWLMFCGNASLTLHNTFLAEPPAAANAAQSVGFLFVEYPGYGECAGRASREGIHRSVEAAVVALAEHLSVGADALWQHVGCFGHSLGAAVALETAAAHHVEDAVVVSPFRSIEAMASRTTGAPVSGWIRHNFDNEVALQTIAGFEGADVHLFHGADDHIIPVEMGRELAAAHPDVVTYHEIADTSHNDILGKVTDDLRALLFR